MDSKRTKFVIRVMAVLWIVVGVVSVLPVAFSVMIFDAPGSTERLATIAFGLAAISFPLVCFVSAFEAFASQRSERVSRAYWALLLPLINLAVAGAAVTWIQLFQGGKLNG